MDNPLKELPRATAYKVKGTTYATAAKRRLSKAEVAELRDKARAAAAQIGQVASTERHVRQLLAQYQAQCPDVDWMAYIVYDDGTEIPL